MELTMSNTRTLAQISQKIKTLEKRTIQNVIEIGKLLHEASEKCPHGGYMNWVKSEFSWSGQTALNYRHVYNATQKPNSLDFTKLNISISAVYFVARMFRDDPCPEIKAAAKAVIAAAKKDRVNYPTAVAIYEKYMSDHPIPQVHPIPPEFDVVESDKTESDVAGSDEVESDEPELTIDRDDRLPLRFGDKVAHALRTLVERVDEDWTESAKTITRIELRKIIGLLELAYSARVGDDSVQSAADRAEATTTTRLTH
jgi:hypothetical protein